MDELLYNFFLVTDFSFIYMCTRTHTYVHTRTQVLVTLIKETWFSKNNDITALYNLLLRSAKNKTNRSMQT